MSMMNEEIHAIECRCEKCVEKMKGLLELFEKNPVKSKTCVFRRFKEKEEFLLME